MCAGHSIGQQMDKAGKIKWIGRKPSHDDAREGPIVWIELGGRSKLVLVQDRLDRAHLS